MGGMRRSILGCLLLLSACESAADAAQRLALEGRGLLEARDYAGATDRFTQATASDPTLLSPWSGLALSEAALAHWPEARLAAEHCIALTDDPTCRVVHADAAREAGDWATVIEDQSRALVLDPARTELLLMRARASAHLSDAARTEGFYREAIAREVEPAASRLELARLVLERCGPLEGMDEARATATRSDRNEVRELLLAARSTAEGETLTQIDEATVRLEALDAAARAAIPNPDPHVGLVGIETWALDALFDDEISDSFGGLGLTGNALGDASPSPSAEPLGAGISGLIGRSAGPGTGDEHVGAGHLGRSRPNEN